MIADAKRGDVPVTAGAYAQAFLGEAPGPFGVVPGLGVDALTVNPCWVATPSSCSSRLPSRAAGGSSAMCGRRTPAPPSCVTRATAVAGAAAHIVAELGAAHIGDVGLERRRRGRRDRPRLIARLRTLMPQAIFLMLGVGAGGPGSRTGAAAGPYPAAALVTASRSIVDAHLAAGGEPAAAATRTPRRCEGPSSPDAPTCTRGARRAAGRRMPAESASLCSAGQQMPRNGRPSPARLLAPLALALFALALVLVVFTSNAGDDGGSADSGAAGDRRPVRSPAREARAPAAGRPRTRSRRATPSAPSRRRPASPSSGSWS